MISLLTAIILAGNTANTFKPRWRNFTMLTIIEQRTCDAICSLATTLEKEVPKITKALDSIATDLSRGSTPSLREAEPDDLPF